MILKRWKTISKKKMEDYLKKNYLKMEDDLTKKNERQPKFIYFLDGRLPQKK